MYRVIKASKDSTRIYPIVFMDQHDRMHNVLVEAYDKNEALDRVEEWIENDPDVYPGQYGGPSIDRSRKPFDSWEEYDLQFPNSNLTSLPL